MVEFSPSSAGLAGELGYRLATDGGAALIIDYGYASTESSIATGKPSLRGIRQHAFTPDFLMSPGDVDLSADVDFTVLADAAVKAADVAASEAAASAKTAAPSSTASNNSSSSSSSGSSSSDASAAAGPPYRVAAFGPVTQSVFLQAMGLSQRLQRLLQAAPDDAARERLVGEAVRLAHPEQMGSIYKALALMSLPRDSGSHRHHDGSATVAAPAELTAHSAFAAPPAFDGAPAVVSE